MSLIQVNYHTAIECIEMAFSAQNVPYLKGSPGIGKSGIFAFLAAKYKLKLIDIRLSQMEPVDLMGFPLIDAERGRAGYLPMDLFPIKGDPIPEGYNGWLILLDELPDAEIPTLKAAYKIILDRMVGMAELHEKAWVGLGGNLDTDNGMANPMPTPLQSRISPHLELTVDVGQWIEWANDFGIDHRIVSFVDFRPDLLHRFDPDHDDCTYPCPRTWERSHEYINKRALDGKKLKNIAIPMLAGTLGAGAAMEFMAFCEIYTRLPRIAEVLANPTTVELPSNEPDVIFALSGMVSHNVTPATLPQVMKFIARLEGDFQALTVRNIRQRHKSLANHIEITKWLRNNSDRLVA